MKLLLDTCTSTALRDALVQAGHDVDWCARWPEDPGDEELIRAAHQAGRVIVTLDKDFGELAVVRGLPHAGIVRIVDFSVAAQARVCAAALARYADELRDGAIVTVDQGQVRVRPG